MCQVVVVVIIGFAYGTLHPARLASVRLFLVARLVRLNMIRFCTRTNRPCMYLRGEDFQHLHSNHSVCKGKTTHVDKRTPTL